MTQALTICSALLLCALPVLAGDYLTNDTGEFVNGLRVVFSEPVTITGYGDILTAVHPDGVASEFVFTGAGLDAWGGHWLNWEPNHVRILSYEWLAGVPLRRWDLGLGLPLEIDRGREEPYWAAEACRFTADGDLLIVIDVVPPDSTTETRFKPAQVAESQIEQYIALWTPELDSVQLQDQLEPPIRFGEGWSHSYSAHNGWLGTMGNVALVCEPTNTGCLFKVLAADAEAVLEAPLGTSSESYESFSFSPSGRYLVVAEESWVTIWDTASGQVLTQWALSPPDAGDRMAPPVFGFDEEYIVLMYRRVGQTKARVMSLAGNQVLDVTVLAESSSSYDATIAAVANDRLFLLWDRSPSYAVNVYEFDSDDVSYRLNGPNMVDDHSELKGLAVHPSGEKLVVFGQRWNSSTRVSFVHLWDIERGTLLWNVDLDADTFRTGRGDISISSDGKLIAVISSSGEITVLELPT